MSARESWFRLASAAALLAALVLAVRSGADEGGVDDTFASACELNPPRDDRGLEDCLALNPRDIELMLDLGALYEGEGRLDQAEELYRQAAAVDSRDGDVRLRLACVLLGRGDAAGAAREARAALSIQPGSTRALELIARASGGGSR